MKYGKHFENESVPEWSLHNIDYNTLKHYIKVHTTRGQARAITIPGHQDAALRKFEDDFYEELCRQHGRVGLFVSSKADELSRRLQHLSDDVHNTLRRCASRTMTPKRQRRLARYGHIGVQCGDEIHNLARFVNAQVIAFRKILKKYKKWTGSQNLDSRFRETVLSDPKSFTNRDFRQLETQYEDLVSELRAATPTDSCPTTPADEPTTPARRSSVQYLQEPIVVLRTDGHQQEPVGYWNEYDNGSEAGDADGGYAIYIEANDDDLHIPGFSSLMALFSMPVEKAKAWLGARGDAERQPLLPTSNGPAIDGLAHDDPRLYGTVAHHGSDDEGAPGLMATNSGYSGDEEDLDLVSDGEADFPRGYEVHFATLPSINEQRIVKYRDTMLFWGTTGANVTALVLLGVTSLLISTGRHKLQAEVDAGVTFGVMGSLACACAALGMTMARDGLGWVRCLVLYVLFALICVANGALLVLVVGTLT